MMSHPSPTSTWKRIRRRARLCLVFGISISSFRHASAFSYASFDLPNGRIAGLQPRLRRSDPIRLGAKLDKGTTSVQIDPQTSRAARPTEIQEIRRAVAQFLQKGDFEGARDLVSGMLEFLVDEPSIVKDERTEISASIDEALQTFYNVAFAPPYRGGATKSRISLGVGLLQAQLSSSSLVSPYNTIPKPVLLSALKALTGLNEVTPMSAWNGKLDNADAAYRILQRLVTGVGLRNMNVDTKTSLQEKDFNLVLNAYTNVGRMDMAHRIVALQERTPDAPVLSAVAFSILLKGYGKLGDLYNVEMLLGHAEASGVGSDTIMLNSLIDAYINCGDFDRAKQVFQFMRSPSHESVLFKDYPSLFDPDQCPTPNRRTFNIVLKGLANRGLYTQARELANEMEAKDLWDHVTTNTLVQAAVKAQNFEAAEEILEAYTSTKKGQNGSHPNAEAYTTIVDGFAKSGEMTKAAELLKTMKSRGVEPNEFTYTCLIGALAKNKKIDQATKMLKYMKSVGLQVRVVTYNAFISGLAHRDKTMDGHSYEKYVDQAIMLLKEMMLEGTRPNTVTVSVLVGAFGKCDNPRISEALSLVNKLETDGIISRNNLRISTALIQVLGAAGSIDAAVDRFRGIKKPDVASINALLEMYINHDMDKSALVIFQQYFHSASAKLRPDVISYSTMIRSALKRGSQEGSREARRLYEEMKFRRRIMPDNALVDIILKATIENGKCGNLLASDVRFVAGVLRDAEKLDWGEGQLEGRKRAVQTVMTGYIAGTWKEESSLYGLTDVDDYEDELFKKHGWNKVDSGFRLWGAAALRLDNRRTRQSDGFLQSKGWNDVDSGFRII